MNSSIFRSYDIRGKYPSQVNEKLAFWLGQSLGKVFSSNKLVLVGHDARLSSPSLYFSLLAGLKKAGFKKILKIGFATKPMLIFLTRFKKAGGGIMITASHNPKEENGFKLVDSQGIAIGGEKIFKKILSSGKVDFKDDFLLKGKIKKDISLTPTQFHKLYVNFLSRFLKVEKPLKVIVDCSNGAAGPIWELLKGEYQKRGVTIILLNQQPDGNFPAHGPDPLKKFALTQVAKRVKQEKANLGIVFDGDGDRVAFVDNLGRRVFPPEIWRLFLIRERRLKTIYSITNDFDMKILSSDLAVPSDYPVFSSWVGPISMEAKLKEKRADLGLEDSGHYYFKDFFFSDSGILAAILVINKVSLLPYPLAQFLDFLPSIKRSLPINIPLSQSKGELIVSRIGLYFEKKEAKVKWGDGILVDLGKSWFSLRKSHTQNLLRLSLRALDWWSLLSLKKEILGLIKKYKFQLKKS